MDRWPRVPILMITGFVGDDVERLVTDGVLSLAIGKPIPAAALVCLFRTLCAKRAG